MQTLWTRALQVKSTCRCPSCLSPHTGRLRRVNTTPFSRRLRPGDVFTVFYSSVLATAAVADGLRKDVKREGLNNAISDERAQLQALAEEQELRLKALGTASLSRQAPTLNDHHLQTLERIRALQRDGKYGTRPRRQPNGLERSPVELRDSREKGNAATADRVADNDEVDAPSVKDTVDGFSEITAVENNETAGTDDGVTAKDEINMLNVEETVNAFPEIMAPDKKSANTSEDDAPRAEHIVTGSPDTIATDENLTEIDAKDAPKVKGAVHTSYRTETQPATSSKARAASHHSRARQPDYKLLLQPRDFVTSRTAEEAWASWAARPIFLKTKYLRETQMAKLVYRLILSYLETAETRSRSWPRELQVEFPNSEVVSFGTADKKGLSNKIRELRFRETVLASMKFDKDVKHRIEPLMAPQYSDSRFESRDTVADLVAAQNDGLMELLGMRYPPHELISRLCSTLLTQKTHPNIHTFNLLIIRLCHSQLFSLAQEVILTLTESRIAQNEVTSAAILNYCRFSKDVELFKRQLQLMDVTCGDGTNRVSVSGRGLAINELHFVSAHREVCLRQDPYQQKSSHVIYAKAYKNQEVFEASILGCLEFDMFDHAMNEFALMLRFGIKASPDILLGLIQYGFANEDWELGWSAWEQSRMMYRPKDRLAYYWMLQLCATCRKNYEFDLVLSHGRHHGVLLRELRIGDFFETARSRHSIRVAAREVLRLQHDVWIPGLAKKDDRRERELDGYPLQDNLFRELTMRYFHLAAEKEKELGHPIPRSKQLRRMLSYLQARKRRPNEGSADEPLPDSHLDENHVSGAANSNVARDGPPRKAPAFSEPSAALPEASQADPVSKNDAKHIDQVPSNPGDRSQRPEPFGPQVKQKHTIVVPTETEKKWRAAKPQSPSDGAIAANPRLDLDFSKTLSQAELSLLRTHMTERVARSRRRGGNGAAR